MAMDELVIYLMRCNLSNLLKNYYQYITSNIFLKLLILNNISNHY